jgi:hypothetical protein
MGSEEIILVTGVLVLILIIPFVFYLITLQKTLEAISPENRKMAPGQVWLLFIPLFNLIWQFIVVNSIADSIAAECRKLNITTNEARPTAGIGIAKCVLSVCGLIPYLGSLCSVASIICWIIYWVKVAEYKNQIIANTGNGLLDAEKGIFHGTPQP